MGNVSPVFLSCSNYMYQNAWDGYEQGGFSTAAAACAIANQNVGAYTFNGNYFCTGSNYYRALCMAPVFSCPANSQPTGNSCTCNDPYVPDPTATSCVPEQYTIALSGLGGVVRPTTTRDAYATVTASNGSPKSGAQVSLTLTVVPENGAPILASNVGSISPNGGSTGADGRLNFVFTAPVAGGTHTITASCTNCTNQATGTIKVPGCPEPPLSELTDLVAIDFDNGNRWRPDLLTAPYKVHLSCVETAAGAGHYAGTSAYRPTQYQRHLYEIIKKDVKLDIDYMIANPTCKALRDEVTNEMADHGLKYDQDVAEPGKSHHESGEAFDLTLKGLTDAQMTAVYAGCGVTHTAVPGEPWHVE